MIGSKTTALNKERIATELENVRSRSLGLLDVLPEHEQMAQHAPIMSPLVWDLAHVGNFEDIWLLRGLGGPCVGSRYDEIYDAFAHPRADRPGLELLPPKQARQYIKEVRSRVLDDLEQVELDAENPLLKDGFVYGMVVQHEHQHDETMLATLQLMSGEGYARYAPIATPAPLTLTRLVELDVVIPGGPFIMGNDDEPWAYDNERGAHEVNLPTFRIEATPVTNERFAVFVEAGGYEDQRLWEPKGWEWIQRTGIRQPRFWKREGNGSWTVRRFGLTQSLPAAEPVQHVSWYEADAFARWAGKRLPTEAEWEKAASWDPQRQSKRRYPWGDEDPSTEQANLGQRHFGPATAGAYADGASAYGVLQMIGDVWEWTSSDFLPYPSFASFPYPEYSEVFFGDEYKILRGGSWATHPTAIRATFRNWDYPIRRQIFAGFRCAADV